MVKDCVHQKLFEMQKKYGTAATISVAKKSLKIGKSDVEFKQQFNGELCETILELLLKDSIRDKHEDWFYSKSLVLPDAKTQSDFLTEIDFVVYTPQCVFCIECKSYQGEKQMIEDGTVVYRAGKRDVYKQNVMHLEVLDKMIGTFSKQPSYQMILFNFSTGNMNDRRAESAKREFPVVDEKSIIKLMELCTVGKSKVWDTEGLRKARVRLENFSSRNHNRHLEYVKSLHGKEE